MKMSNHMSEETVWSGPYKFAILKSEFLPWFENREKCSKFYNIYIKTYLKQPFKGQQLVYKTNYCLM